MGIDTRIEEIENEIAFLEQKHLHAIEKKYEWMAKVDMYAGQLAEVRALLANTETPIKESDDE